MSTVTTIPKVQFRELLRSTGISLSIGPFNVNVKSRINAFIEDLYFLYSEFPLVKGGDFIDFYVELERPGSLRRWIHPQADFVFDGYRPFRPLPLNQATAFFEWGLNWAIAQHAHQYLIIHAGVVEKNGKAIIFPGTPGAGKSTLTAALSFHGWRLLSDEQALVSLKGDKVYPISRPVNIKNQSIPVIQEYCPDAELGRIFRDTNKGDIAHVKPPQASVIEMKTPATPYAIVFPRYNASAIRTTFAGVSGGSAFMKLIEQSFNYGILADTGFRAATSLVENCKTYHLDYSDIDEALDTLDKFVNT